jgi:hypothetical protein
LIVLRRKFKGRARLTKNDRWFFVLMYRCFQRTVWISVTTHPTAEWVSRQIIEALPWNEAQRYMIRDRGSHLPRGRHSPIARHGHSGLADYTNLAPAEWRC